MEQLLQNLLASICKAHVQTLVAAINVLRQYIKSIILQTDAQWFANSLFHSQRLYVTMFQLNKVNKD